MNKKIYELAVKKHPKLHDKVINYGTAGFRSIATDLDHVLFRMGILACLRSKKKDSGVIGLMITASHNPAEDNGVKLIDPSGEMLEQSWESIATRLANVDDESLDTVLDDIVRSENIRIDIPATVFIGEDTRPSSRGLAVAAFDGVTECGGTVVDYGIVTTPLLHYLVNSRNSSVGNVFSSCSSYMNKLSNAFKKLRGNVYTNKGYVPQLYFDGANGVGAIILKDLLNLLEGSLNMKIYNDRTNESMLLNNKCGADYVKMAQKAPEGMLVVPNARCVSFDGDADRIVYFFSDENGKFYLLDGDRIATLVAGFLMDVIKKTGLNINLGLVQTAYANGASTNYIANQLKVPVACVSTGVKHLHQKATEFDVGVYFEANGHGTVVFKKTVKELIENSFEKKQLTPASEATILYLENIIDLVNETVGDALADMLLVETILHSRGWSIHNWLATYDDLPNRQLKVTVKDRNIVETKDAERYCVSPPGVQAEIDKAVKKYANGRSFIRPSGTEDVVRVYAEAATQESADSLANDVADIVRRLVGGV